MGVPVLVASPRHVVNAVALYQDVENPLYYTLMVYDNNQVGKLNRIRLVKKRYTDGTHSFDCFDMDGVFGDAGKSVSIQLVAPRGNN